MSEEQLQEPEPDDIIEPRAQPRDKGGRFAGTGGGKSGKTKYAPSPRRNSAGITVGTKKYSKLCGTLNTNFPGLKSGEKRTIRDAKHGYNVTADGSGGMTINRRFKL